VRVALNTGFDGHVTQALLGALGWPGLVDAVACVDDVPEGRPAPYLIHTAMQRTGVHAVREVAVLGDTPSDVLAGANAGARFVVGVLSGAHTAASLRRHPLTHLIDGVWELPAFLARQARLADRVR
jgi:phosphonatase-like hydrolase